MMHPSLFRPLLFLCALLAMAAATPAQAQGTAQPFAQAAAPESYEVLGLSVEGVTDESARQFVLQSSGLRVGQQVTLPGDQAISDAIRRLYELGNFTDIDVTADRFVGGGVFLTISVEEVPRLAEVNFEGIKGGDRDELRKRIPLLRGRALRPADIERAEQVIQDFYADKGFRLVTIDTKQQATPDGNVAVTFDISRGRKIEVGEVRFAGNESFGDGTLRKRLKNTPEDRWWRFWGSSTFDPQGFEEDKKNLIAYYNDRGYYSARILEDSVHLDTSDGDPQIVVDIHVAEGPQYHIRDVAFEGNVEYTDEQLRQALAVQRGEVYNRSRLESSLYYNPQHTDITSLYSDRGYLRFNIQPQIVEVSGDSLDITFYVDEGDVYQFGEITIRGNTRTKEHVIRRQIRTIPGQTYSRQAIERSIRELIQLGYFDQQKLAEGPRVSIDEEAKVVNLTYSLVETGGDQLELSGGWGGGGYGLILQARVAFNNFSIQNLFNGSAWQPVPSGDGQQLALSVQTSGLRYQSYFVTFTEPWFRGRNTPVGGSLSYTYRDFSNNRSIIGLDGPTGGSAENLSFSTLGARLFYRQGLKWPDDFFQTGTDLGYRLYSINGETLSRSYRLPEGTSQELTIRQSLTRNSFDSPQFPSVGSSLLLSAEIAPPIPGFIQYHKERVSTRWVTPIAGRLALDFSGDFGYIGSLTGDDVEFQRYLIGGSPLEAQSAFQGYGKDIIYMRGYPTLAITPIQNGQRVGGRILNKYSMEARLVAIQTPQFTAAPYAFVDAANTWNSFGDYNPAKLYRSAGFGAKLFLPFLGMIDLNYGYQIDSFTDFRGGVPIEVAPRWRFQFSLGG